MDIDLFEKAVQMFEIKQKLRNEELLESCLIFLDKCRASREVIEFMKTHSYTENIRFNHVYFYKTNDLIENNLDEQNAKCISERLLIVGAGLNGDPIVLDLDSTKIGFVFHDELWEDEEINVHDAYVDMGISIGEFYYNSMTLVNFPVDGSEAEKFLSR